ncbi:MAG: hypothetical protein HC880_03405 [Bacteroidia bacterium]|nr:hypothetical protein [Bacteroidia bacterium]
MYLTKNLFISILFFSALLACEQETGAGYEDWDTNRDDLIGDEEFYESYRRLGHYEEWDLDDDGYISDSEYFNAYYSLWDKDQDGQLDEQEWDTGLEDFAGDEYVGVLAGKFADWDTDQDNQIDVEEFNQGWVQTDYYSQRDQDASQYLDKDEFYLDMFTVWDTDGDGNIERAEYEDRQYRFEKK